MALSTFHTSTYIPNVLLLHRVIDTLLVLQIRLEPAILYNRLVCYSKQLHSCKRPLSSS